MRLPILLALAVTAVHAPVVPGQGVPPFPLLGTLATRHARDITASNWSIGGETLDRDFAVYAHYKKYLGPLGAKAIRLQAGWAKCEKRPGVYDWSWLDEVVDDARAQGVQPWLQLSYGNLVYTGGGDPGLGGGFPSSPEALAAWDRWVRAAVTHFKDRVHEWEIWNEPDLNHTGKATVGAYVDLYIRTATIIRDVQPGGKSKIYALALAGDLRYAEQFLAGMAERQKLDLIDAVTFHTYPRNPDDTGVIDRLRELIARTGRPIAVRQGETGAPAHFQKSFALSGIPFTETKQAKWDLRRMLAHHGRDVPFNLFTIIDLHYRQGDEVVMNYKGLLATRPDMTVDRARPAYHAAQRVFSVFDDRLVRLKEFAADASPDRKLAAFAYRSKAGDVVTLWFKDEPPADNYPPTPTDLTLTGVAFREPVYADLLSGKVYALPRDRWSAQGQTVRLRGLPLHDSPVLVAERSALPVAAAKQR